MTPLVYVVDDHLASAETLAEILSDEGYRTRAFPGAVPALEALASEPCDVLVTDLRMDGLDGLDLLREAQLHQPGVPVIVVTAHATIDRAIQATRSGAFSFVRKPLKAAEILVQVRNAADLSKLRQAVGGDPELVGRSPALTRALATADRCAQTDLAVLIQGESGTGKELLARRIHARSDRSRRPFVAVNCGAIPETLIEAELFGSAKGAYTGADRDRRGLIEAAEHGTLFLDEVGELSTLAQVRLLRFLQERVIRRVGETRERQMDVRVIAATHQELRDGDFRDDLYYRLAVLPLTLPPLRERGDDLLVLLGRFLADSARRLGRPTPSVTGEALAVLRAWPWPGNVRELLNLADRLVVLAASEAIGVGDLPPEMIEARTDHADVALPEGDFGLTAWLEGLEERALRRALAEHDGVKARAAASLGLERNAFRYKLGKYGVEG